MKQALNIKPFCSTVSAVAVPLISTVGQIVQQANI
jgi:hypothetical protein